MRRALRKGPERTREELCKELWNKVEADRLKKIEETRQDRKRERDRMLRKIMPRHSEVAKIIKQHANQCVFYPAAGLDWAPLHYLSGDCDLFVYCDWNEGKGRIKSEVNRFGDLTPSPALQQRGELQCRRLVELTGVQIHRTELLEIHASSPPYGLLYRPPYVTDHEAMAEPDKARLAERPFAWLAEMERVANRQSRRINLLYLSLEGVAAYWLFFAAQAVAPKYVILFGAAGFALNWTDFYRWERALGRAVDTGPVKPEFVISGIQPGDRYDWPWNRPVKDFADWNVTVYGRPQPPLEGTGG